MRGQKKRMNLKGTGRMPAQIYGKKKKRYGQFLQEMPETVDKDKTWDWARKSDLKVETEALIFAAQEQVLRTNDVRFNIDKSVDSLLCRM